MDTMREKHIQDHPSSLSAYELLRSDFAFLLVSGHIGVVDDFCRLGDAESEFVETCVRGALEGENIGENRGCQRTKDSTKPIGSIY